MVNHSLRLSLIPLKMWWEFSPNRYHANTKMESFSHQLFGVITLEWEIPTHKTKPYVSLFSSSHAITCHFFQTTCSCAFSVPTSARQQRRRNPSGHSGFGGYTFRSSNQLFIILAVTRLLEISTIVLHVYRDSLKQKPWGF